MSRRHAILWLAVLAAFAGWCAWSFSKLAHAVAVARNATADKTELLQRHIDEGWPVPPGDYPFSGQLVLRWRSLVGAGPQLTRLLYTGPPRPDGCVRVAAGNYGYTLEGFDLTNVHPTGQRKGVGISAGQSGGAGSESGSAVWERVWVHGFETGVSLGTVAGSATSEVVFTRCDVKQCRTAIRATAWNTLNLTLISPGFSHCDEGLIVDQGGCVHVLGGTASYITGDVFRLAPGGVNSIRGFRAETSGRLLNLCFTTARAVCSVEGCLVEGPTNTDGIDILFRRGGSLAVRDTLLRGYVRYEDTDETGFPVGLGSLKLDNVSTTYSKLFDGKRGQKVFHEVENCALLDADNQVRKRVSARRAAIAGPVE